MNMGPWQITLGLQESQAQTRFKHRVLFPIQILVYDFVWDGAHVPGIIFISRGPTCAPVSPHVPRANDGLLLASDRRPWTPHLGPRTSDRGPRTTLPFVKVAPDPGSHSDLQIQIQIQIQSQFHIQIQM